MRLLRLVPLAALAACFGSLSPDRTPTGVDVPGPPSPIPPTPAPLPPPAPVVASLTVSGPATLRVGSHGQLRVTPRDSTGAAVQAPYQAYFHSTNPSVATASVGGLVSAVAPGSTTILVSGFPVSASLSIRVTD